MRIVFYANSRGKLLALEWLRELRRRDRYAYVHIVAALLELGAQGRGLGAPIVLHVADGLHELRPLTHAPSAPLLFFFHGDEAVVLGPLRQSQDPLPLATLVRACRHRRAYERDPRGRSHDGESGLEDL